MTNEQENLFEQGNLLIVLGESYMTGVRILDEQHRGVVSIINSLHHSLFARGGESLLRPTAEMIMGYAQIHFKTEIELLKESGYPRLKEHQARHDQLAAEAGHTFQECLKEGGDPGPFLAFLKEWWQVHIMREDLAYSAHLLEYLRGGRRVITRRG